jgi:hypothetical protein
MEYFLHPVANKARNAKFVTRLLVARTVFYLHIRSGAHLVARKLIVPSRANRGLELRRNGRPLGGSQPQRVSSWAGCLSRLRLARAATR